MASGSQLTFLVASHEPAWLRAMEQVLERDGARVEVVLTGEAALAAMMRPDTPDIALLDGRLPGVEGGQILAAVRAEDSGQRFPIVVFSDSVSDPWRDRLAEGVIDDLLPMTIDPEFLRIRLEMALREQKRTRELEALRLGALQNQRNDRLTGAYNREAMLTMLFRETDRVQRMNTSLCMILFDIDDFGHWNSRLGTEACDQFLVDVVTRVSRLLRSYDVLGRVGKDEFLAGLPGCSSVNAVLLAERIRMEVFGAPFRAAGKAIRLSACFGVASSQGRSPVVVLREAEEALRVAREAGPESIQCAGDCPEAHQPVAFLSPTSGEDLLAW